MQMPKIRKMETKIDAKSALDLVGKSFRFDHVKGMAEWLKNSVDAYLRDGAAAGKHVPDSEQVVIIRFLSKGDGEPVRFECIDFSGTTHEKIVTNFVKWFDRLAAQGGIHNIKTYGGHGNGGKFYMRQMYESSRFLTYRDGKLNVFGFDKDKEYGFFEGFEDKKVSPEEAIEIAELKDLIPHLPEVIKKRFKNGDVRFTVVRGSKPPQVGGKRLNALPQRLRVHPQARNIIETKEVYATIDNSPLLRLQPEEIKPKKGFEQPVEFEIPKQIQFGKDYVELANDKFPPGKLTLYTSDEPFSRFDDRAALNCINFKSSHIGVIASYKLNDLPGALRNLEMTEFVYGVCSCPILEDPEEDLVQNDREHLVESDRSRALLWWICEKINDLTEKMVEKTKQEQTEVDLKNTSIFNEYLNKWKNNFMSKVYGEVFGGANPGSGAGTFGGTGGGTGEGGGKGTGTDEPGAHKTGGGEGDTKTKGSKYPTVLLSNSDDDPLNPGNTVSCDARHPLVYQRREDYENNIYWINTQAPIARKIIDQYTTENPRWREYMFQRYVDIILKQTIHEMEKRGMQFTADQIDNQFDEVGKRLYDSATKELEAFLFQEQFSAAKI